ncbi:zinc-binding dehydrogenase [Mesorhizobium sp. M1307]
MQFSKRRGATVIGVCAPNNTAEVKTQGADQTIDGSGDLVAPLGSETVDVVIDLGGGSPQYRELLELLGRAGRCAVAGAISTNRRNRHPNFIPKRSDLFGCTFWEDHVFENLIRYIESGQFRPVIARVYPLSDIVLAQQDFLSKSCLCLREGDKPNPFLINDRQASHENRSN